MKSLKQTVLDALALMENTTLEDLETIWEVFDTYEELEVVNRDSLRYSDLYGYWASEVKHLSLNNWDNLDRQDDFESFYEDDYKFIN